MCSSSETVCCLNILRFISHFFCESIFPGNFFAGLESLKLCDRGSCTFIGMRYFYSWLQPVLYFALILLAASLSSWCVGRTKTDGSAKVSKLPPLHWIENNFRKNSSPTELTFISTFEWKTENVSLYFIFRWCVVDGISLLETLDAVKQFISQLLGDKKWPPETVKEKMFEEEAQEKRRMEDTIKPKKNHKVQYISL